MRPAPGDPRADLERGARGLSIGVVTTLVDSPETDAEVREAVRRSADTLRGLGARVEDVDLPLVPMAGAVFMALADGEEPPCIETVATTSLWAPAPTAAPPPSE